MRSSASAPSIRRGGAAAGKRSNRPRRLAPLDHIKVLYEGVNKSSSAKGGRKQRIMHKKDLLDAVRSMQGPSKGARRRDGTAVPVIDDEGPDPLAAAMTAASAAGKGKSTLEVLQESVNVNARRYNEIKMTVEKQMNVLEKRLAELRDLQVDNEALQKMEKAQTPDSRRIVELKAQIEGVEDEINEKARYRRSLEHMAKRLRANQVAFDAHIKGMEEALAASKREFDEVKLLMRQLEGGNQAALESLREHEEKFKTERVTRERELSKMRQEAANARRMEEWRCKREQERLDLQAELRGDLNADEEKQLIQDLKNSEEEAANLQKEGRTAENKVLTLEDAFQQIRQATGVRDLDEMVEKFLGQGENRKALELEKDEAEARLAGIKEKRVQAEAEFTEMKASGIGGTELNREIYDKLDDEILESKQSLKVNTAALTRLDSVLVAVRQGAIGLQQRLAPFQGLLDYEDELSIPKTGIESLDLLLQCEMKLVKMLEAMKPAKEQEEKDKGNAEILARLEEKSDGPDAAAEGKSGEAPKAPAVSAAAASSNTPKWTPDDNNDPVLHEYNVRVATRAPAGAASVASTPRTWAAGEEGDDEDEDALVDRQSMKRMSSKMYNMETSRVATAEKRKLKQQQAAAGGKDTKAARKLRQKKSASRLAGKPKKKKNLESFLTQQPDLM